MPATLTEDQQDATALLTTVRHLLTGREIDLCERIVSGEPSELPELPEPELLSYDTVADVDAGGDYATDAERPLLDSLRIQFYAQIANWKNGVAA